MRKLILGVAAFLAFSVAQANAQAMYPIKPAAGAGAPVPVAGAPAGYPAPGYPPAGYAPPAGYPTGGAPMVGGGDCGPNYGYGYGYQGDARFGINPGLKGLFGGIHSSGPNGPGGSIFGGRNRTAQGVVNLPYATGGTLVFPQNPYVRSPRDFFMWEAK